MGNKKNSANLAIEFLKQSNYIELEYSDQALEDSIIAWNYFYRQTDFNLETLLHCHLKIRVYVQI